MNDCDSGTLATAGYCPPGIVCSPRNLDEHLDQLRDEAQLIHRRIRDLKAMRKRQREEAQRAQAAQAERAEARAAAIAALKTIANECADPVARIAAAAQLLDRI